MQSQLLTRIRDKHPAKVSVGDAPALIVFMQRSQLSIYTFYMW